LIQVQSERGRVTRNKRKERRVRAREHSPGPSGSAAQTLETHKYIQYILLHIYPH
jgi:hypothetical protein